MSARCSPSASLTVAYRATAARCAALEAVDLDIVAGERLAVIGESGSGKSTLALALAGLLPDNAEDHGRIALAGARPRAAARPRHRLRLPGPGAPASTRC